MLYPVESCAWGTIAMKITDGLRIAVDHLREALAADVPGKECAWAERVVSNLAGVARELHEHADTAPGAEGPLAEGDVTRPTLARQSDALRREEHNLLEEIGTLRTAVREAGRAFQCSSGRTGNDETLVSGGVPDFGSIRRQGEELAQRLEKAEETEESLVLESVNTDIGVGD